MSISAKNKIITEATREKMSINMSNRKITQEQINNMIATKKLKYGNNYMPIKKSNYYEIYDENDNLKYKFNENFIIKTKTLNLPTFALIKTYQTNSKVIKGKYKGWYAIKL